MDSSTLTDTTEPEARMEEARGAIDRLDIGIIDLLAQRARISARIQQSRISSGGPRTVFSREMDVLARYRNELGADGTQIAMNVLKLCRGGTDPVESSSRPTGDVL
ncbi:chorismate mutase [Streptomyces sp. NPDC050516]|uniref:chorismate mutase n=1 Tax=Streptomyces sp. NPDC050516 TaxID=3365621 RepID=UPI00379E6D97